MKKIFILISIIGMGFAASAEQQDADKIYRQLKADNENTFSMSLSKTMIDFFDMDIDFNGKDKLITGDFHEGRMLVIKEKRKTESIVKLFKSENYQLVKIEGEDDNDDDDPDEAYLFVDRKGKSVKEAHFVVIDDNSVVLLSVFGDIKVENKRNK